MCVLLLAVLNLNKNLTDCKSPSDKREKLSQILFFLMFVATGTLTVASFSYICACLEAPSVVGTQRVAGLEPNPQSIRH